MAILKSKTRRDVKALQKRRNEAVRLFRSHIRQADVARQLGVSRQSVSRWFKVWKNSKARGHQSSRPLGRPACLDEIVLLKLERAFPKAPNKEWTLARFAELIYHVTNVKYHPAHVWRIIRARGYRYISARKMYEDDRGKLIAGEWKLIPKLRIPLGQQRGRGI